MSARRTLYTFRVDTQPPALTLTGVDQSATSASRLFLGGAPTVPATTAGFTSRSTTSTTQRQGVRADTDIRPNGNRGRSPTGPLRSCTPSLAVIRCAGDDAGNLTTLPRRVHVADVDAPAPTANRPGTVIVAADITGRAAPRSGRRLDGGGQVEHLDARTRSSRPTR